MATIGNVISKSPEAIDMIDMDHEGLVIPDGYQVAWEEDNSYYMLHEDYIVVVEEYSRIH